MEPGDFTAWEHFQQGGWAMWLIFAFGLVGTGAAGRFAWKGEHQMLGFIRWINLSVCLAGWFGFFTGMLKVLAYVVYKTPAPERGKILLLGLMEALNNPTAALMFATLITALTAVGLRRFPLPNPSAVPR